ncbi:hypothetical protein [uncultured Paracoccus sp.]|uniref:hypothetical protein n=1 Tax=uncultured Paracoccus sp. TaxID=189685 RepID=UPI00260D697E|nr:hypothetical protein [uncultured Paracoccus sp.]
MNDLVRAGGYTLVTSDSMYVLSHPDSTYLVAFKASTVSFKPFYRQTSETFRTACAREIQTSYCVCNGPYFSIPGKWATAHYYAGFHIDGSNVEQQGQVYINGALQSDSSAVPAMFYVNQSRTGAYTFGEGNPQSAYNAIGNLTPLILSHYRSQSGIRSPIRFGDRNLYDRGAETSTAQVPTGNPAAIHADNLTQRSNTRNGQLVAGEGIVALGYNRTADLLLVLARDNGIASGAAEHEAKSAIEHFSHFGCTDAVAFDVSTSCTMRTQSRYYATPDSRKDNAIEVGFKIGPR